MSFFCFRTIFPVLECPLPVFCFFWESDFVTGRPGTEEFVPGRDAGQGNFYVPGQRDNGTSRPLETLLSILLSDRDRPSVRLKSLRSNLSIQIWGNLLWINNWIHLPAAACLAFFFLSNSMLFCLAFSYTGISCSLLARCFKSSTINGK